MLLTLFLISIRSCDFFSLPPGKEEKAEGFVQNLDIRWSGLSLADLCWCQQRSNRNVFSHVFLPWLCRAILSEHSVLHRAAECCPGLSLTSRCPVVSLLQWILVSARSWTGRWAGGTPSLERLTGWHPRSSPAMRIPMPPMTSRYPNEHLPAQDFSIPLQHWKTQWQGSAGSSCFLAGGFWDASSRPTWIFVVLFTYPDLLWGIFLLVEKGVRLRLLTCYPAFWCCVFKYCSQTSCICSIYSGEESGQV